MNNKGAADLSIRFLFENSGTGFANYQNIFPDELNFGSRHSEVTDYEVVELRHASCYLDRRASRFVSKVSIGEQIGFSVSIYSATNCGYAYIKLLALTGLNVLVKIREVDLLVSWTH